MKYRLNSIEVLHSENRILSIDVLRGIATLSVVCFHFDYLPFGYLGVDLFFVISGALVSQPLIYSLKNNDKIKFGRFFISRGFRIWPSFYCFIVIGMLVGVIVLNPITNNETIRLEYAARYIFFYRNYTPGPHFWTFDHLWSICVEEHFYVILPVCFVAVYYCCLEKKTGILVLVLLLIALGVSSKLVGYITRIGEYSSYTNNRIDALAYGVLISWLKIYQVFDWKKYRMRAIGVLGVVMLAVTIGLRVRLDVDFYDIFFVHAFAPLGFALIIFGFYDVKSDSILIMPIRFIAYYSYNWYLWHPLIATGCKLLFGSGIYSFFIYVTTSFLVAIAMTIGVEEFFLKYRKPVLERLNFKHGIARS